MPAVEQHLVPRLWLTELDVHSECCQKVQEGLDGEACSSKRIGKCNEDGLFIRSAPVLGCEKGALHCVEACQTGGGCGVPALVCDIVRCARKRIDGGYGWSDVRRQQSTADREIFIVRSCKCLAPGICPGTSRVGLSCSACHDYQRWSRSRGPWRSTYRTWSDDCAQRCSA